MTLVWGVILFLAVLIMFIYCIIPTKDVGVIEAEKARLIRKESSDKKKVDKILKPVFKKIDKASNDGLANFTLFDRDWYEQDKFVYQKALKELKVLGYDIRFHFNYRAITISWREYE